MLIDSDVLIWYLRGHAKAAQFLDALPGFTVSAVSYMELVQGCRKGEELSRLKKDFAARGVDMLPITEAISGRAVALVETHFLGGGLRMADALIAATAIEHRLALASANVKHFAPIAGLEVEQFGP
ncbi:MAG: type II toxin-antitoxin system VapC family toxin [Sterolibacteriaceae bacterium]|uniref:Ribonuclease VapC n=1 Tax=Candidatus Methylophosphatis roskildensis TaxID=2899263 RepID=A0A9D7HVU3_9PROT|nr:type II toxin-antitoxin system VapC family toxin [Candidatus Methylophosphatis roskildensis]MBK7237402.1 type II toxin-antitoxin system VapC family toxin [Sterolibacteriaceae bacterium]